MMPRMLLFFNISGGELAVVALIIFIVLGPDKLPEIARKFGKTMRYIRKATNDIKREINIDEDLIQKPRSYSHTKKTSSSPKTENAEPIVDSTTSSNTKSEDNKSDN